MIYSGINQLISNNNWQRKSDAIKAAEKAYVIGCRIVQTHILCTIFDSTRNALVVCVCDICILWLNA